MLKIDILEIIKERLNIFTNIYDVLRVIDPANRTILSADSSSDNALNSTCYHFWKKNKVCTNCVMIRALRENSTFMKIETKEDKVFITIATPVNWHGKSYVVELLKDVTNDGLTIKPENEHAESIDKLMLDINNELVTDALTGVYNRRFIDDTLPFDIEESSINRYPLSIILTDIDNFKNINDTFGHVAGDYILKEFAQLISKGIRKTTDWVARYGGEEFLILLRNSTGKDAYKVAEKLRELVDKKDFVYEDTKIKLTASFGICYLERYESIDVNAFIQCADKNLYAAKEKGRNQVIMDFYKPH